MTRGNIVCKGFQSEAGFAYMMMMIYIEETMMMNKCILFQNCNLCSAWDDDEVKEGKQFSSLLDSRHENCVSWSLATRIVVIIFAEVP
ncbi:hypothetical protein Ccrd_026887 [Cynara cardunculus var. scolymus]|uniref:Uncharacterized protein n=1 Tax=Cynara cardunculus var. scolymus TaxID=59895 RepID=A0A103XD14_CYNCS|nr:hypothetical protein Ccrd_026887 [Cynara cardunculus var. scolymus]